MSTATNQLVTKKALGAAGVVGAFVLGASLFRAHGEVHAAPAAASLDDHSVAALTSLDEAMESLAARVTPAVVNVAVTSRGSAEESAGADGLPPDLEQFFDGGSPGRARRPQKSQIEHGVGSGIIISPEGYILTNNHVVDGAVQVKVTLHDRRILTAQVVGVDKLTDLAVLKVNATGLPSIGWGDSTRLRPGQTVLAFGSPFGFFQFSVTRGIVSAVDRPNPYSDDARKPGGFIQTDAAINPGNSGGALVNAHGELVGINTFIISNNGSFAGAGFAIPSQIARATAEQIIRHGKADHGYLGISMNDVTPENAQFFNLKDAAGAIVSQVTPDSPAGHAGLKTGDVIATLNGKPVVNGGALQVAVSQIEPGTAIALGVFRDGKPVNVNLTVGEYHAKGTQVADVSQPEGAGGGKLGLAITDLSAETRGQIDAPDDLHGVVVESVRPASPADEAGIRPGDVILEVDRHATSSANDFIGQVRRNPAGKDILLLVWSKGGASYRTVHPDAGSRG